MPFLFRAVSLILESLGGRFPDVSVAEERRVFGGMPVDVMMRFDCRRHCDVVGASSQFNRAAMTAVRNLDDLPDQPVPGEENMIRGRQR